MTDTHGKATTSAPVWALLLGAAGAGGVAFLLVALLGEQVRAFALGVAGAPPRLMLPLALGNLAGTFLIWGVLRFAFRKAWKRNTTTPYVWLGILLWASVTISALALVRSVNLARIEADRAAAAVARLEQAAIDGAIAGFPDEADTALLQAAFREMQGWADPVRGVRDTVISRDPGGDWEAVCGQVSFKDGRWAGFVSHRTDGYRPRAALQQDGFDAAKAATCKPIVDKYVGVDGVDMKAYVADSTARGCTDIDIYYWEAWKTYCRGRLVIPKSSTSTVR